MPSIDDSKCILITGATSGIGRALALALAKLPSRPQVIAAGRRKERLEELSKIEGIRGVPLNLDTDLDTLKKSVEDLISRFPDLDTVILNAGTQQETSFKKPEEINLPSLVRELNVNYVSNLGFITYVLPHFLKRSSEGRPSFIITMSSGVGIVPAPMVPNYSATKAALHSLSISLRAQLHDTNVHVIEIIPPLVESELHDASGLTEKLSKIWMPLDEFTKVTVEGLRKGSPNIPVGFWEGLFQKYEADKDDFALSMMKRQQDLLGK